MGVWGAIANKTEASQETFLGGKNNPSLQIIKRYVPKKKASIQSYLFFLKAYVDKLEILNYIDMWGSGPEASGISKNQIKWKPDIFFFFFFFFFFYFLAVLPKSPKICACSPAPLK